MGFADNAYSVVKNVKFFSYFFNDLIGNAVLCVACVLMLSYLREIPPKFERKGIVRSGIVLSIVTFVQRFNVDFFLDYTNREKESPSLIMQSLSAFFENNMSIAKIPNVDEQLCLRIECINAVIGLSCICAGAFMLMRIFKAKHIVPMVVVQITGFLLRGFLEYPYKVFISSILHLDVEDVKLFGYNGFVYGCFMIITIILYILSTRHAYEVFWTKSVDVRKHILSLAALFIAYSILMILANQIVSNDKTNPVIELIINFFLAVVLLPVPMTTYYVTRANLQEDFDEVKRKEKVEKYDYSQKQNHELNDAMIKYIHDLPAHFMAIGEMASKMNAAEIAEYINELDKKLFETKGAFSTGNEHLDGLLNKELKNAEKDQVTITFKGVFPPEGIKRFDITTVFINLVENAIEACKSVSGKREIIINSTMNGNRVYVDITNPFEHTIKKSRGKFETTKRDKEFHGYGMDSIAQVVESKEYDGTFSTEHKNNLFTASFDMRFCR